MPDCRAKYLIYKTMENMLNLTSHKTLFNKYLYGNIVAGSYETSMM